MRKTRSSGGPGEILEDRSDVDQEESSRALRW